MATITPRVLRDQIRGVLLERIYEGAHAPGQRIVETQALDSLRDGKLAQSGDTV